MPLFLFRMLKPNADYFLSGDVAGAGVAFFASFEQQLELFLASLHEDLVL